MLLTSAAIMNDVMRVMLAWSTRARRCRTSGSSARRSCSESPTGSIRQGRCATDRSPPSSARGARSRARFRDSRSSICRSLGPSDLLQRRGLAGHDVEHARVLRRETLALLGRVALTEQPLEQLARVELHRQRRRRRAERDRRAVAAAVVAIAADPGAAPPRARARAPRPRRPPCDRPRPGLRRRQAPAVPRRRAASAGSGSCCRRRTRSLRSCARSSRPPPAPSCACFCRWSARPPSSTPPPPACAPPPTPSARPFPRSAR